MATTKYELPLVLRQNRSRWSLTLCEITRFQVLVT